MIANGCEGVLMRVKDGSVKSKANGKRIYIIRALQALFPVEKFFIDAETNYSCRGGVDYTGFYLVRRR
jgi:hypothetical protein